MRNHHHLPYSTGHFAVHCVTVSTPVPPDPLECHGNGNGKGNGKKYGMMSSSAMMRPEEAGADTASLRLNATTHPMSPHLSPIPHNIKARLRLNTTSHVLYVPSPLTHSPSRLPPRPFPLTPHPALPPNPPPPPLPPSFSPLT